MNYYPEESSDYTPNQELLTMECASSPPLQLVLENNSQVTDLRDSAESGCHVQTLRGHVEFTCAGPVVIDDISIYFKGDVRIISEELSLRDE